MDEPQPRETAAEVEHFNDAYEDTEQSADELSRSSSPSSSSKQPSDCTLPIKTDDELPAPPTEHQQFRENISYVTIEPAKVTKGAEPLELSDSQTDCGESSGSGRDSQFAVCWRNLDYVVESKWYKLSSQRKPILDGLSGCFRSGELTAILGPSGAGKSTLIDCLLGKREKGLRGKTRVVFSSSASSSDYEQERRRRRPMRIACIPQEDHLLDTLTVMETFMFASKIKNAHLSRASEPTSTGRSLDNGAEGPILKSGRPFDHFANVQRVLEQLNLSSCANAKCGKLSGGQYKRVSIGQELLSWPDIMILDEPTSGLDSVTCFQTISALRRLIDSSPYPMAIVSTIHQPDTDVFNLFHKAYVLAPGGRAIYEGPVANICESVGLAAELAEARRKQASWGPQSLVAGSPNLETAESLGRLTRELDERGPLINPARLIVEIAANKYGYELTSAMNELQRWQTGQQSECEPCGGGGGGGLHPSNSSASVNSTKPAPANLSSASLQSLIKLDTRRAEQALATPPPFDYQAHEPARRRAELDRLLNLAAANTSQRRGVRVYLRHLCYHTQRSWLTILRDPMLFSVQVALHVLVPLLISYSFEGQRGEACPAVGPLDVIEEAYRSDGGDILDDLSRELRHAFENIGYMFFQIYVIIFAAVCVTSLTYPLAMHVLLKEYRNGWYSLSSYFLGRTLADLPVPTFNVTLAMAISYHLTGQPLSPYAWRFVCVASLTVLATLVAQTQGLMFGAMLMNAAQSAVFVAPASTAPLVVVSGFLIRIKNLPSPLQFLSRFSYFTHLLNGFIVSRYGFNRCPCDPADFQLEEARQVPQSARGVIDIWVDSFRQDYPNFGGPNGTSSSTSNGTDSPSVDLVGRLVDTVSRAKTFGFEMTECSQVKPYTMLDYELQDADLEYCFWALILMLLVYRWLTYLTLSWKINSSI